MVGRGAFQRFFVGAAIAAACGGESGSKDDPPAAGSGAKTASHGGSGANAPSGGKGGSGNAAGSNVPASGRPGAAGTTATGAGAGAGGTGAGGATVGGAMNVAGNATAGSGATAGSDAGAAGIGGDAGEGNAAGAGGSSGSGAVKCDPGCGSHKWACWPMPNPAGSGLPNEASYSDQGDTVVDDITCLEWQKAPTEDKMDWVSALDYCDDLELGGSTDWRLPTRVEVASIWRFRDSPLFDPDAFPDLYLPSVWTASVGRVSVTNQDPPGEGISWALFTDGASTGLQTIARNARCVRGGGAGEAPLEAAVQLPDHYAEVAAGEIRDNYTGLVWQQGQSPSTMPFADAAGYCATLTLGGQIWRLPSGAELQTLVDEAHDGPAVDPEAFPDVEWEDFIPYWAFTASEEQSTYQLALMMADAYFFNPSDDEGWVKCVRFSPTP